MVAGVVPFTSSLRSMYGENAGNTPCSMTGTPSESMMA
jgi:hypothetical protein